MVHDIISDIGYPTGPSPCHRLCLRGYTQSKDLFWRLQLRETSLNSSSLIWGWISPLPLMKKTLHFCCKANLKWVLVTVWRILCLITFWPLQPLILTAKVSLHVRTFSKSTKYIRPKCIFAKKEVSCQLNKSWTAMSEYKAVQFCQFSPAHYGIWHVQGICLWWKDHIFRDRQEGFLAEAREEWVLPRTDSSSEIISGPEQLREAAEFGFWHLQICSGSKSRISVGPPIPTYPPEKAQLKELAEIRSWCM